MDLDLATMYGWIVEELAAHRPIGEAMNNLIERGAAAQPHSDWGGFRKFPWDDLSALVQWIEKPFRLEPPAEPLQGLWFGIFNPCYEKGPVSDIYVCGSKRFDANPDDCEWAVGPDWWPELRYAHSELMASIYRMVHEKNGPGGEAEYLLCLGYGAIAVRELLNRVDSRVVLDSVGTPGVAVGFDSGDFVLLGRFTRDGLGPL
jgi:hypothetical protein